MNVLDNISWKQLCDRVVAVDTNTGDYYTFNEVASTIWVQFCDKKSVDEIIALLLEEYDITDADKVRKDIDAQVAIWKEMHLIS